MFAANLKKLFGIGTGTGPDEPAEGLTAADRKAIAQDLAILDRVEAGLGEAVTRHILTGNEATAFLRVETLLKARRTGKHDIVMLLQPYGAHTENPKDHERSAKARERVVLDLEGFDPAAMRRYGELFALQFAAQAYFWNHPGTDRSPAWLRALVAMVGVRRAHWENRQREGFGFLSAPRILAMLAEDGTALIAPLVECGFSDGEDISSNLQSINYLGMEGMPEALADDPDGSVAAISALAASGRQTMIGFLADRGLLDVDPRFFDFVFASAGDGSRVVREAAVAALAIADEERIRSKAAEALRSRQSAERLAAVNVLLARLGAQALPILETHEAGGEKAKGVLQAIATARAAAAVGADNADGQTDGADGYVAFDGKFVAVPPPPEPEPPVPGDLEAAFRAASESVNEAARADYDRTPVGKDWNQRPARPFKPPLDPGIARSLVSVMRGETVPADTEREVRRALDLHLEAWNTAARRAHDAALSPILARSDIPLGAIVRLVLVLGNERETQDALRAALDMNTYAYCPPARELRKRFANGGDLRVFAAVAEASGVTMPEIFAGAKNGWWTIPEHPRAPANDTVWPVLATQISMLEDAFGGPTGRLRDGGADFALMALRFFPRLPRRFFPIVVDRAAQGQKRIRNFARWLLRDVPDLTPVITPMLEAGPEATRIAGARWLAERRNADAIPALRAALKKEKAIAASAAILSALAACGDDVSDQFSEDKLLADARAGLAKTKADYSALFDADALPSLCWADGRPVPPDVVRWWFARSHKLKDPAGDPLLHMALERLDRDDAERLGREILSAFVGHDTRRPTSEEANAYAAEYAPGRAESTKRYRKDYTEDLAFAELRREKLAEYLGSALDHRGLLALARFAPPAESTAIVKRYLRDHGKRPNQCRALVDMLMANPVPATLQLVLAASQRHKQPGLRKYAGEVTARFAEERGWTPAELADRTIPAAGLDETGAIDLPVGERTFRARLEAARAKKTSREELRLVLENPDGKPVASLPSPADPEEASQAKEAKSALSAAKKELKQTVELQTGRLYEAMCAGRIWPREDFEAFLLSHPIVSRLLRRLVLTGHDVAGKAMASFRALDDGTFTDADDERVAVDGFHGIAIAHRAGLGDSAAEAWVQHLADYEVDPLFEQLARPTPGEANRKARSIDDRRGHMIDNLTLRSAAEALGYVRGSVEDGAGFYAYEKAFPDAGFVAVIEFSGSYIGENDRVPKYLTTLAFESAGPERRSGWGADNGVPLADVPPVLVSETWNDYREIAAKGTGFDADHELKGGW